MDIDIIKDGIYELENSEVNTDNIIELACLYIVQQNLGNDTVENELEDILPHYKKYVAVKTKYQKHEATEDGVLTELKRVCLEVQQFIKALYGCTDFKKERKIISKMIENLNNEFIEK